MSSALLAARLLADEGDKSGPIGFAVILVLCVICYFLFKSMSRHLRKVREEFPGDPDPSPSADPAASPASSASPADAPAAAGEAARPSGESAGGAELGVKRGDRA